MADSAPPPQDPNRAPSPFGMPPIASPIIIPPSTPEYSGISYDDHDELLLDLQHHRNPRSAVARISGSFDESENDYSEGEEPGSDESRRGSFERSRSEEYEAKMNNMASIWNAPFVDGKDVYKERDDKVQVLAVTGTGHDHDQRRQEPPSWNTPRDDDRKDSIDSAQIKKNTEKNTEKTSMKGI